MQTAFKIAQATSKDIAQVAVLLDLYRQFYGQNPDLQRCESFIRDRILNSESVIFVATARGQVKPIGFTQLYPTFCSVAAGRLLILYDLFVCESERRKGVGRQLMRAAEGYARREGAVRIQLETHHTNAKAQRLYEELGYQKEQEFYSYSLSL